MLGEFEGPKCPNQEFGQHRTSGPSDVEGHPRAKDGYTTILGWIHSQWIRVFFNCFLLEPIQSALGFSQPATLKNLRKRLCGGTLGCQALVDHWWIGWLQRIRFNWAAGFGEASLHAMKDASLLIWFLFEVYMVVRLNWYIIGIVGWTKQNSMSSSKLNVRI